MFYWSLTLICLYILIWKTWWIQLHTSIPHVILPQGSSSPGLFSALLFIKSCFKKNLFTIAKISFWWPQAFKITTVCCILQKKTHIFINKCSYRLNIWYLLFLNLWRKQPLSPCHKKHQVWKPVTAAEKQERVREREMIDKYRYRWYRDRYRWIDMLYIYTHTFVSIIYFWKPIGFQKI